MQDELIIKYIKKRKEIGIELLIDNYRGIITSVVRKHLGVLINYEEECIDDVFLSIWDNIKSFNSKKIILRIGYVQYQNTKQSIIKENIYLRLKM